MFRSKALSLFYRELSHLLASGMPVVQAMAAVAGHAQYGAFRSALWDVHRMLQEGVTLADGFAACPRFFPQWHVAMVRAGEKSGKLADILAAVSRQLEKNYSDLLKVVVGLAYPALLLVLAVIAMPVIQSIGCGIGGGSASGAGRWCAWAYYAKLLVVLAGCGAVWAVYRRGGEAARSWMQQLLMAMPVAGGIIRQFAVTRFTRALQSLCGSGVPIITSWKLAAEASGNDMVKQELLRSLTLIERGGTISESLAAARVLPSYMVGMISSGEKSGSIVKALESTADFCEKENDAAIGVMVKIVPTVIYLMVAVFVAFSIVTFYTRYFNAILNPLNP